MTDHVYEDTVRDFDTVLAQACAFMGLPWREEMRRFAQQDGQRSISTPSSTQVARGLYNEGVGQWRRYSAELSPVLPILRPWVQTFGYPE